MTPRLSAALAGILLAAFGLFATAPQTQTKSPADAARLNNLGAAYMNQQLFEKGLKSFQQASAIDPKLTIAHLNEGIAFLNLQKIDEAKAALQAVLKQHPKNPTAWYNLGLLAKNTGDAQAAIDAFNHVIEIDRTAHVEEVVGTRSLHDLGTFVEDLEDPSRARSRARPGPNRACRARPRRPRRSAPPGTRA